MKRILMVVSDGSWDCNVFSNRPGYDDCNGCVREWENPQNVITLVTNANKDPNTPVETFIEEEREERDDVRRSRSRHAR